eukprot:gene7514-659_t
MALPEGAEILCSLKCQQDALAAKVVWGRVRGYPFWPAQVLSKQAAQKRLGNVGHKKDVNVPIMFFGTLEIAWLSPLDVVDFKQGVGKGYLQKAKHKSFLKAVEQVVEFLALDKKRRAPHSWWCKPPSTGRPSASEVSTKPSKVFKVKVEKIPKQPPSAAPSDYDDDDADVGSSSDEARGKGQGKQLKRLVRSASDVKELSPKSAPAKFRVGGASSDGGRLPSSPGKLGRPPKSAGARSGAVAVVRSSKERDSRSPPPLPAPKRLKVESKAGVGAGNTRGDASGADVLKLPAEIRRLAGIKVAKSPHASPQTSYESSLDKSNCVQASQPGRPGRPACPAKARANKQRAGPVDKTCKGEGVRSRYTAGGVRPASHSPTAKASLRRPGSLELRKLLSNSPPKRAKREEEEEEEVEEEVIRLSRPGRRSGSQLPATPSIKKPAMHSRADASRKTAVSNARGKLRGARAVQDSGNAPSPSLRPRSADKTEFGGASASESAEPQSPTLAKPLSLSKVGGASPSDSAEPHSSLSAKPRSLSKVGGASPSESAEPQSCLPARPRSLSKVGGASPSDSAEPHSSLPAKPRSLSKVGGAFPSESAEPQSCLPARPRSLSKVGGASPSDSAEPQSPIPAMPRPLSKVGGASPLESAEHQSPIPPKPQPLSKVGCSSPSKSAEPQSSIPAMPRPLSKVGGASPSESAEPLSLIPPKPRPLSKELLRLQNRSTGPRPPKQEPPASARGDSSLQHPKVSAKASPTGSRELQRLQMNATMRSHRAGDSAADTQTSKADALLKDPLPRGSRSAAQKTADASPVANGRRNRQPVSSMDGDGSARVGSSARHGRREESGLGEESSVVEGSVMSTSPTPGNKRAAQQPANIESAQPVASASRRAQAGDPALHVASSCEAGQGTSSCRQDSEVNQKCMMDEPAGTTRTRRGRSRPDETDDGGESISGDNPAAAQGVVGSDRQMEVVSDDPTSLGVITRRSKRPGNHTIGEDDDSNNDGKLPPSRVKTENDGRVRRSENAATISAGTQQVHSKPGSEAGILSDTGRYPPTQPPTQSLPDEEPNVRVDEVPGGRSGSVSTSGQAMHNQRETNGPALGVGGDAPAVANSEQADRAKPIAPPTKLASSNGEMLVKKEVALADGAREGTSGEGGLRPEPAAPTPMEEAVQDEECVADANPGCLSAATANRTRESEGDPQTTESSLDPETQTQALAGVKQELEPAILSPNLTLPPAPASDPSPGDSPADLAKGSTPGPNLGGGHSSPAATPADGPVVLSGMAYVSPEVYSRSPAAVVMDVSEWRAQPAGCGGIYDTPSPIERGASGRLRHAHRVAGRDTTSDGEEEGEAARRIRRRQVTYGQLALGMESGGSGHRAHRQAKGGLGPKLEADGRMGEVVEGKALRHGARKVGSRYGYDVCRGGSESSAYERSVTSTWALSDLAGEVHELKWPEKLVGTKFSETSVSETVSETDCP